MNSRNIIMSVLSFILFILSSTSSAEPPKTAAQLGFTDGFPPKRVVDMTKWDKGEDARWAFQHISEIIPTANISRGTGAPSELARSPQDFSGMSFEIGAGKSMTVTEMLDSTYTDGFIVLKDRAVVFEKYYNGMTSDTRHLLMSVSKSVTGTIAGTLVNDGRLNPEKKVVDYIPELKNSPGYTDATVREVLDMTTSIIFVEDYDDPEAEIASHEQATAWRGRTPIAEEGLYAFAQTIRKDKREHGEIFHYASINTDVLGWLIERSSSQRFIDFMSQAIWSKLGAEHDAQLSVDYLGSPVANGGFVITLRDLARFGQMVLDDGYYNGEQIIPSGWIDDIRFNGKNSAWKPTKHGEVWPDGFYRNQWYVTKDDHGSFFAVGVNGQHIWINPTTRVVIVKFSSFPKSADTESAGLAMAGMDAIARSFSSE
jgi:CubicO group peptidase (beta-lactamase class C family)